MPALEREGERENAAGRARQANNDVMDETDGVPQRSVAGDQRFVTGLYDTPDTAGRAYNDLTTKHGYNPDDISVVMSDETRKQHFGDVKPGELGAARRRRVRGLAAASASVSAPRSVRLSPRQPRSPSPVWVS